MSAPPLEIEDPVLPPPLQMAVDRLDAWCRTALTDQENKDRVDQPLYHYSSIAALKAIADSQELWFTDYRHLNDPKELRLGVEQAHEALRLAQDGADGRVGLFLRCAADLFTHDNLDNLGFFVGSFSRARDDLGQWRAYADNGRGVAIGYAPKMFAVGHTVRAAPNENAFVGPVVYDPNGALDRHRTAIDAAVAIFHDTVRANVDLLRDKDVGFPFMRIFALRLIGSALIWNALTTKHSGYAAEHEVRLITMGTAAAFQPVTRTRVRGSEVVPYIKHPWPAKGRDAIAEIVIGPSASQDADRGVRTLLASSGIADVPIARSEIPYRVV